MTKSVPAFIARTQFGQILNRVAQNRERFVVTRKGEATAVILGIEDFLQTVVKPSPEQGFPSSPETSRDAGHLIIRRSLVRIQPGP